MDIFSSREKMSYEKILAIHSILLASPSIFPARRSQHFPKFESQVEIVILLVLFIIFASKIFLRVEHGVVVII